MTTDGERRSAPFVYQDVNEWPDVPGIVQQELKRRLIIILLDTSLSMEDPARGADPPISKIAALNLAIQKWLPQLRRIEASVEFAVVTFGNGGVRVISGSKDFDPSDGGAFVPMRDLQIPALSPGGVTPMLEAIDDAIDLARQRSDYIGETHKLLTGTARLLLFSDGEPTTSEGLPATTWPATASRISDLVAQRRIAFYAFGVPGCREDVMQGLTAGRGYFPLPEDNFDLLLDLIVVASDTDDDPYDALWRRLRRR